MQDDDVISQRDALALKLQRALRTQASTRQRTLRLFYTRRTFRSAADS